MNEADNQKDLEILKLQSWVRELVAQRDALQSDVEALCLQSFSQSEAGMKWSAERMDGILRGYKERVGVLMGEHERLHAEAAQLRANQGQAGAHLEEAQRKIKTLEGDISFFQVQAAASLNERDAAMEERDRVIQECEALKAQVEELHHRLADQGDELSRERETSKSLREELEAVPRAPSPTAAVLWDAVAEESRTGDTRLASGEEGGGASGEGDAPRDAEVAALRAELDTLKASLAEAERRSGITQQLLESSRAQLRALEDKHHQKEASWTICLEEARKEHEEEMHRVTEEASSAARKLEAMEAKLAAATAAQDATVQAAAETADAAAQIEGEATPNEPPAARLKADAAVATEEGAVGGEFLGGGTVAVDSTQQDALGDGPSSQGHVERERVLQQLSQEDGGLPSRSPAMEVGGGVAAARVAVGAAEASPEASSRRRRLIASEARARAGVIGDDAGSGGHEEEEEDDDDDVLAQAAQEKVDMLLLLSQEQERSRLDAANVMLLTEQREDLRSQLQQAVREKVEALMALSDMAAECRRAADRKSELDAEVHHLRVRLQQAGASLQTPEGNAPSSLSADKERLTGHGSTGGLAPTGIAHTPTRGSTPLSSKGTPSKHPGEGEQDVPDKGPPVGGWASLSSVGASVSKLIKGATVAVTAVKSGATGPKAVDADNPHAASKFARLSVENASMKGRVENLRLLMTSVHNLRVTLRDQARVHMDGHLDTTSGGRHPGSMPSPIRPPVARPAVGGATTSRAAAGPLSPEDDALAVVERVENETLKMMHALSAIGFSSAMSPHGHAASPHAPATVGAVYESLDGKLRKLEMHPDSRGHIGVEGPAASPHGPIAIARGELEFDTEAGLEMAELLLQCCLLRKVILSSKQAEPGGQSDTELPTSFGSLSDSESRWPKK